MDGDRVAIVTGASRGLGAVIARVLAERGYDLVIGGRNEKPLEQVADALAGHGVRVGTGCRGHHGCSHVRAQLVDAARTLGGLDVLVNNASELGGIGPLMDFDVHALRAHLSGEHRRADGARFSSPSSCSPNAAASS